MWWAAAEFDTNLDELVFRVGDGRLLMWTPGFDSPHDLRCPCVVEIVPRMSLEDIRNQAGWKNQDLVKPDDGKKLIDKTAQGDQGGAVRLSPDAQPVTPDGSYADSALVVKLWERGRYETQPRAP